MLAWSVSLGCSLFWAGLGVEPKVSVPEAQTLAALIWLDAEVAPCWLYAIATTDVPRARPPAQPGDPGARDQSSERAPGL